ERCTAVESKRHHDAPYSRTTACVCARFGKCTCQAGATPATGDNGESAYPPSDQHGATAQPPSPDDVCHALEQSAAENALPVEFFARVIWQESRFNASAVSPKGAESLNSCRGPPVETGSPIRSIRSSRCGIQRLTCGSC